MKRIPGKPLAQGELVLVPVSNVPATAKPVVAVNGRYIIGHSETGHHHVIDEPRVEVFEAADDAFCAWIKTLDRPADLVHLRGFDTHETLRLEPKQVYRVHRQREYTLEGWRRAAD